MRLYTTWKGVPTLLSIYIYIKKTDSTSSNFIVSKLAINLSELHKKSDFKAQEMFLTFSQLDKC